MFHRLKSLLTPPPPPPSKFIPPDQMTAYQAALWHRCPAINLTEDALENLVGFFAINLNGRWSLVQRFQVVNMLC
jgi:hypothetical protein